MIIRDNEEIIFYITPKAKENETNSDEICLWTNCKALVQAFYADFETSWGKATNILEKVAKNKSPKGAKESIINMNKYLDITIRNATREILILTSTEGLQQVYEKIPLLIEKQHIGVTIRILAPIVSENLNAAQQLSKYCEVRHVPIGYLRTTIVDGTHLFQTNNDFPIIDGKERFKDVSYYDESEIILKTKNVFNNIWEKALAPSSMTLRDIVKPPNEVKKTAYESHKKIMSNLLLSTDKEAIKNLSEKDIVNQIIYAQAYPDKNPSDKIVRHFGTAGQAVIHPPSFLNLPDMLMIFSHYDKHSTYGEQDFFIVLSWQETPKGKGFMPSAFVYDNNKSTNFWKKMWGGTFFTQPLMLVRQNEIQIQAHGDTLFAGWTIPIPLSSSCILPPAFVSLEGYGNVKPDTDSMGYPSGYRNVHVYNGMDAFVTFMHPSSKYSGPGTDGVLARESIVKVYPPEK
jgi:hypothetical protein